MINQVREYIHDHYPTKVALVTGIICVTAAVEMALHVPYNIYQIRRAALDVIEKYKYNLSASLGGAIFYGLCGLNIIPRTAAIGAGIFTLYSVINFERPGAYLTSRIIGGTIKFITKDILLPITEHVLAPVIRKIATLTGHFIGWMGKIIMQISLPRHPIWIGVVLLGAAIAIYKLVLPRFTRYDYRPIE